MKHVQANANLIHKLFQLNEIKKEFSKMADCTAPTRQLLSVSVDFEFSPHFHSIVVC